MPIQQSGFAFAVLGTMLLGSPAATHDGAAKVTTIAVSALGNPTVARIDTQGTIHLLCDSQDGPRYARSTDGGATFGPAIPVVVGGSQTTELEYSAWDMALG